MFERIPNGGCVFFEPYQVGMDRRSSITTTLLNLVSFWPEIASRKARPQSCQARSGRYEEVLKIPFWRTVVVILVLQPQILAKVFQAALVVAAAGPGLMAPSPPGPGQHRFVQRHGPPDQPVQQAAHLGNRQWYQGFIPLRFSPFFPLKQALAFCRTTAR